MILHPGVLALLTGGVAAVFLVLVGSVYALQILRGWNFSSSSERQLALERRTYLVSTTTAAALGFEAASGFLFVYTADELHGLLTGAMCATGSLNANPVGWWALGVKLVLVFACGLWIVVNRLDAAADDYPLVRLKYGALLLLLPLVLADFVLQLAYFRGLRVGAITSCCGSLFEGSGTVASSVAALPPEPMLRGFAITFAALFVSGFVFLLSRRAGAAAVHSLLSAFALPVSLASVVSFVSIYLYELPTHHCPFDLLQSEYGYVGYPLYLSLFVACFFGTLPGALSPLRRVPSLGPHYNRLVPRWIGVSLFAAAIFVALVTVIVMRSHYRLGSL